MLVAFDVERTDNTRIPALMLASPQLTPVSPALQMNDSNLQNRPKHLQLPTRQWIHLPQLTPLKIQLPRQDTRQSKIKYKEFNLWQYKIRSTRPQHLHRWMT